MNPFTKQTAGIYIHWPYCLSKCPYCDFASSVCTQIDEKSLLNGYLRDITYFKEYMGSTSIISVFFGGGTPSLMSPAFVETLLNHLYKHFSFQKNPEISLEANPDAIDAQKMRAFSTAGINRLSIGVQSLNEKDLHFLGRKHSVATALKRIEEALHYFNRLNIDLIYARPTQTLKSWEKELTHALSLGLSHYSLYQLSLEEGTPFFKNQVAVPSDKQATRLYCLTQDIMTDAGILPYEISNYAQQGQECLHNLVYWKGLNYLGIGPAAHGRIDKIATSNDKNVQKWLRNEPILTPLSSKEKRLEKILMGLRLIQEGFPCCNLNQKGIQTALKKGWITCQNEYVFTTLKGRLMLNQLILLLAD